jgi:3-hydroxyisobutyrate dehydrogenase-like beta-hydroxyacid dehydrogenase
MAQSGRADAQVAATPAEAAASVAAGSPGFVMSCVGADDDLRAVLLGPEGAFAGAASGTIFVDHTTTSAEIAQAMAAEAAHRGFHFLDAPVSGGQAGAEAGQLTVMCGGPEAAFAAAKAVIDSYARACLRMGDSGAGQLAKMVNQICIAGLLQGLAEGMSFGVRAGLDMDIVIEAISKGAAQSWQMENRGRTMLAGQFDFGFAVDWMRKDLGLCLAEARRQGARLPVAALVDQFYAAVQANGGGRWDTSSLMTLLDDETAGSVSTGVVERGADRSG